MASSSSSSSYATYIRHLERDAARTAKQKEGKRRRGRKGRRRREAGMLSTKRFQLCTGLAFCVSSYWLAKCFRKMQSATEDPPGEELRVKEELNLFESVVKERANNGFPRPEYPPQQSLPLLGQDYFKPASPLPPLDVGFQSVSPSHQRLELAQEEEEEEEEELSAVELEEVAAAMCDRHRLKIYGDTFTGKALNADDDGDNDGIDAGAARRNTTTFDKRRKRFDPRNAGLAYQRLKLTGMSDSGLYTAEQVVSSLLQAYCFSEGGGSNRGGGESTASSGGRRCESRGGTRFSSRHDMTAEQQQFKLNSNFHAMSKEESPKGFEMRIRSGPFASPCLLRSFAFTVYRKHAAAVGKALLATPSNLEQLKLPATRYPASLNPYHSAPCLPVGVPANFSFLEERQKMSHFRRDASKQADVVEAMIASAVKSDLYWRRRQLQSQQHQHQQQHDGYPNTTLGSDSAFATAAAAAAAAAASKVVAAAAVVCIPEDWAKALPVTRIPFVPSQAQRWSKLHVKSSIVDEIEITRQQSLNYVPGSWVIRHLVLFRDPARVALTRTAVLGIFSWDSELLQEAAEATASVGRWLALRYLWHSTVLDPLDSLVWFYEDLEEQPLGSLHALCRFLRLEFRLNDRRIVKAWKDATDRAPLRFEAESLDSWAKLPSAGTQQANDGSPTMDAPSVWNEWVSAEPLDVFPDRDVMSHLSALLGVIWDCDVTFELGVPGSVGAEFEQFRYKSSTRDVSIAEVAAAARDQSKARRSWFASSTTTASSSSGSFSNDEQSTATGAAEGERSSQSHVARPGIDELCCRYVLRQARPRLSSSSPDASASEECGRGQPVRSVATLDGAWTAYVDLPTARKRAAFEGAMARQKAAMAERMALQKVRQEAIIAEERVRMMRIKRAGNLTVSVAPHLLHANSTTQKGEGGSEGEGERGRGGGDWVLRMPSRKKSPRASSVKSSTVLLRGSDSRTAKEQSQGGAGVGFFESATDPATGVRYYFNRATLERVWVLPPGARLLQQREVP